jgi:hypothetical protein
MPPGCYTRCYTIFGAIVLRPERWQQVAALMSEIELDGIF